MGFMKRAILYVTRKKEKSILLFFLLLVMSTFILTGFSINKATQVTQSNLRQTLGGKFNLSPDYSENNPYFKIDKDNEGNSIMYTERPVTKKMIDTVMSLDGIKSYDATAQTLVSTELDISPGNVPVKAEYKDLVTARIVATTKNNRFFQSGIMKLIEGNHITTDDSGVAIISNDLAKRNNLELGDIISLQSDGETSVQIIGIFEIIKPNSPLSNFTSFEKLENQIFTDLSTFQKLIPHQTAGFDTVSFKVNDPAQLDKIVSQLKSLSSIDWQAYVVETDNQTYLSASAPLLKLQALMSTVLIIITVVSAIVLSLVLTMWSKNRIYETGVFLSVGIGKITIIGQYLVEVLLIAVFAFGLSFFTSNAIAGALGNELLQQNEQAESQDGLADNSGLDVSIKGGGEGVSVVRKDGKASIDIAPADSGNEEMSKPINVTIGFGNIVQLYLIGFAIITFSVVVASMSVMYLKPREILIKMS